MRGDPQIGTEDHTILGPRTSGKDHRADQLVRTAAFLQAGLQVEVVRTQQGPIRIKKDIQSQRRNRQAQSQGAFQMALNQSDLQGIDRQRPLIPGQAPGHFINDPRGVIVNPIADFLQKQAADFQIKTTQETGNPGQGQIKRFRLGLLLFQGNLFDVNFFKYEFFLAAGAGA